MLDQMGMISPITAIEFMQTKFLKIKEPNCDMVPNDIPIQGQI